MSDLERKLLARLIDPNAITEVWAEGVRPEWFEEPLYQAVFHFTLEYWRQAQMAAAPTVWALTQEFPGYTVTDDAEETTSYLASLLRRRFTTNRLQDMVRTAATDSVLDPVGALKVLHAEAFAASEIVAPRMTRTNMADTIEEDRATYERGEAYPQGLGAPYGLDLLDLHTGGLLAGEVAALGAFSKTGKTMFGLHAMTQALRQGYHPLVFSLEMGLEEIRTRLAAMYSGVSYNRLSKKQLSDDEKEWLWACREDLKIRGDIEIRRPEEGDRTVASLLAQARQYGADHLFIDQLSYLEAGQRTYSLKEHHAVIMRQLKNEVSRAGLEIPCLLAVQANRESVTEGMTLKSFANATEIEQVVDIAIGLWRNQDMRNNSAMCCEILGSRRTDTAKFLLGWELSARTQIRAIEEIRGEH